MKLNKLKIRGLGDTPESAWFKLDPHKTVITFDNPTSRNGLLNAIETINPLYDCKIIEPFSEFPSITHQNGVPRTVKPEKRTIVLAIFDASPTIIQQCAQLSSLFYEIDKIEIGRRLDYSRWMNFVELASSTRWREISDEVLSLMARSNRSAKTSSILPGIQRLLPSDRIKGAIQKSLSRWLNQLVFQYPQEEQQMRSLLLQVDRTEYFQKARTLTYRHLPLFVKIDEINSTSDQLPSTIMNLMEFYRGERTAATRNSGNNIANYIENITNEFNNLNFLDPTVNYTPDENSGFFTIIHNGQNYRNITSLSAEIVLQILSAFAIVLSRIKYNADPVLIFNGLDSSLMEHVDGIARYSQCIVATDKTSLSTGTFNGTIYKEEDIIMDRVCA